MYRGYPRAPQVQEGDPRRGRPLRIIDPPPTCFYLQGSADHVIPVSKAASGGPVIFRVNGLDPAGGLVVDSHCRPGLGSAWTTLHLIHEKEAAELLGIPDNITQTALLPVAYFTGSDFKPAKRLPARDSTHWNTWGQRR
jgi:hypothetical protein